MKLWLDAYDPNGNRVGEGPIVNLTSATVKRMLDGTGSISFSVSANDQRAVRLLTNERRVRLFVEQSNGVARELGRGIIRQSNYDGKGWMLSFSGPDNLDELKRISVLFNRAYDNQTMASIASSLTSLVSGWSSTSSATQLVTARFDSTSVLKALQGLVKLQGLHFRQILGTNSIEVGAFGNPINLTAMSVKQITDGMYSNDNIAFLDDFKQKEDTEALVNRLYVIGAGANVDSALTLEKCTRTTPYPVQSVTVNGRKLYYIEDTASIAEYGVIEKVGQFKEIAPLSNNDTDVERAANAMYDAAVVMLQRYMLSQQTYTCTLRKCMKTIQTGDKIRVVYKEPVLREDGSFVPPRNIDSEFWVMSVSENVGSNGMVTSLTISNIDRYEESVAKKIIGSLDQIQVNGMMVQPTISHNQYGPEQLQIDNANDGKVQLIFSDATFSVDRVLMRVRTQPFTSTAKSAQSSTSASGGGATSSAGGDHNHRVAVLTSVVGFPGTSPTPYFMRNGSGGGLIGVKLETANSQDLWTEASSGDHSHNIPAHTHTIPSAPLDYGIYKDNLRPQDMTITVNGVSVTPLPIGTSGSDLDTTIDITPQVNAKSGGFRGVHNVVIECASGQGDVLVNFDIYETITPFKFGV